MWCRYVRLFLYSMMCLCFGMVLFWQPRPRHTPRYTVVYQEDDAAPAASDDHNRRPPPQEEIIHAIVGHHSIHF